jgi:thiosulfate dehydrogenase [quinone] large subunit
MALLPLRLFLGVTFAYAGIQKLSDPGFLHSGAPTYIGTQLQGFADGTPGSFILHAFALPHPELAGVGVAIVEIAIGLLTIAGLLTRLVAAAGLALSLLLFLTASWHTTPYFLGPDIVFVFAWLPFVLAGAAGQPALDNLERPTAATHEGEPLLTRRALVAEIGVMALAVAGIASLLKGTYNPPPTVADTNTRGGSGGGGGSGGQQGGPSPGGGAASPDAGGAGAGASASASAGAGLPSNAVALASSSKLPTGQGATYTDPGDGGADIIIRQADGSLTAFSAVCTHAGCTVGYQGGQIVCPCHGATYDPTTGAVTGGPAPQGLAPKQVLEQGGKIYAVPS